MTYEEYLSDFGRKLDDGIQTEKEYWLREFVHQILHGDDKHRAWLTDACEFYIAGKEIPKIDDKDSNV